MVLTFSLVFIALWVAFMTAGGEPQGYEGAMSLPVALGVTLALVFVLYLVGLRVATSGDVRSWNGLRHRRGLPIALTALVAVGAMLGLVASLRALLWGGPLWLRWSIVAFTVVVMVIGSGRAWRWAVVGGMVWAALGVWSGIDRDPTGTWHIRAQSIDLLLTGALTGTTLGALVGILVTSRRRKIGSGW
jgi:hypothetical protein